MSVLIAGTVSPKPIPSAAVATKSVGYAAGSAAYRLLTRSRAMATRLAASPAR